MNPFLGLEHLTFDVAYPLGYLQPPTLVAYKRVFYRDEHFNFGQVVANGEEHRFSIGPQWKN